MDRQSHNGHRNLDFQLKSFGPEENMFWIMLHEPTSPSSHLRVSMQGISECTKGFILDDIKPHRINPYVLEVALPEALGGSAFKVTVFESNVDGICLRLGSKNLTVSSHLQRLELLLRAISGDPVTEMCHAFGVESQKSLDLILSELLSQAIPKTVASVFNKDPLFYSTEVQTTPMCMFPTMLHFACAYGLKSVCHVLLQTLPLPRYCTVKNKDGQTASGIAEERGYTDIAALINATLEESQSRESCQLKTTNTAPEVCAWNSYQQGLIHIMHTAAAGEISIEDAYQLRDGLAKSLDSHHSNIAKSGQRKLTPSISHPINAVLPKNNKACVAKEVSNSTIQGAVASATKDNSFYVQKRIGSDKRLLDKDSTSNIIHNGLYADMDSQNIYEDMAGV